MITIQQKVCVLHMAIKHAQSLQVAPELKVSKLTQPTNIWMLWKMMTANHVVVFVFLWKAPSKSTSLNNFQNKVLLRKKLYHSSCRIIGISSFVHLLL